MLCSLRPRPIVCHLPESYSFVGVRSAVIKPQMNSVEIRYTTDSNSKERQITIQNQDLEDDLLQRVSSELISLLEQRDSLYNRKIADTTQRDSKIPSKEMTERVLNAFFNSIEGTKPKSKIFTDEQLRELVPDQPTNQEIQSVADYNIKKYLEKRLEQRDTIKLKAKKIAVETGLSSHVVGGILGHWRRSGDAPFSISATEKDGTGNFWHVTN